MRRSRLSQVEQRIARLIEGGLARLFAGRLHPHEVAIRLARAIEDNAQREPDGTTTAPNLFTVRLHPDDLAALLNEQPDLARSLAEGVADLAARAAMRLVEPPRIALEADPVQPLYSILVEASHSDALLRSTQMMPIKAQHVEDSEAARNPQLIIQGTRYVALDRPVMSIGRRSDNQIVINDAHISRQHAQLRLRFGRYVLYDLGSRGGTFVNDHRITECILRPGDVISLAGIKLIYVEDDISQDSLSATSHKDTQRPTTAQETDPTV